MNWFKPSVAKLKENRDVAGLIKALGDGDERVRADAVDALVELHAVEPLIEALDACPPTRQNARVFAGAADALGQIGDERAVDALISGLQEEYGAMSAADALGQIGDKRAVEPLIAAMKDPPAEFFRGHAAQALGLIGDRRAVEPLVHAMADSRFEAAIALSRFGDRRSVEALVSCLGSSSPVIRYPAAEALARLGDPRGRATVVEDLKDPTPIVRRWAAESMERMAAVAGHAPGSADVEVGALESLKARLESLPSRYPTTATVVGPGARQGREQVTFICRTIDDALRALESGRDNDGRPITVSQVGRGLQNLVNDTSGPGIAGLMYAVLSADGLRELGRSISELADIAARLCASDEIAAEGRVAAGQSSLLERLSPVSEAVAMAVFRSLGIDQPNHYADSVAAFAGFRQYMPAWDARIDVSYLWLGREAPGEDFVLLQLADTPPLGLLICALKGGGFLGYYRTGSALKHALGVL